MRPTSERPRLPPRGQHTGAARRALLRLGVVGQEHPGRDGHRHRRHDRHHEDLHRERHAGGGRGGPEPGAGDRPEAEARVQPRHERPAEAALDVRALDVHRDVPDPDAQARRAPGRGRRAAPTPAAARRRGRSGRRRRTASRRARPARAPRRCTIGPDSGSPAIDPPETQSSSRPSCADDSPRVSRTAGVREIQEAKHRPLTRKATATAVRARRAVGDTCRSVTTRTSLSNRFDDHGTPGSPPASTRYRRRVVHRVAPGRPTLAAVAARAGVSPSTASLTFAASPRVAPATRDRVLAAAAELGYAGPDPIAASLRRGRTGVIGAFVGERLLYAFRDPVAVQLLDGITEVLGGHGVGLLLLAGDAGRPAADQLARIPLDAAIFATCGLEDDPALDLLRARGVPVVGVEGPVADDVVLIDIDDRAGTAAARRAPARPGPPPRRRRRHAAAPRRHPRPGRRGAPRPGALPGRAAPDRGSRGRVRAGARPRDGEQRRRRRRARPGGRCWTCPPTCGRPP